MDKTADIDVVYFTTLLNNLLSNAVKYSDKKPEIEIEGFHQDDNILSRLPTMESGSTSSIRNIYSINSTGLHQVIFTNSKVWDLGLYYVKEIAEAHGGDVMVNSRPGKGSTFTVTFPGES